MRSAGIEEGQQIEELPDLDELALADVAHQGDGQVKLTVPYRTVYVGNPRTWLAGRP
jgi:hypothetical protein